MLALPHADQLDLVAVPLINQILIDIIQLPEPGSTGASVIMAKIMQGYLIREV